MLTHRPAYTNELEGTVDHREVENNEQVSTVEGRHCSVLTQLVLLSAELASGVLAEVAVPLLFADHL